jgi:hypothetical protein
VLFVLLLHSAVAAAQEAPVVRGRVVADDTGAPIAGARVTLSNADGTRNTLSGPSGDYAFDSVPSGRFKVRAARPGLVGREYGQPSSGTQGRDVDVRDGAQLTGIDIALTRGTAISGVVTGDRGEPLEGVGVQLFRFDDGAGRTRSMSSVLVLTSTDDHGRFRLLPQAAGKYYVGAILVGASHAAGPVYFPDRVDIAGATPIQVEQELDVENVDIRFASTIGTRVSGTAVDADGKPLQEGRVLLSGGDISRNPVLPRTSDIEHGRFEFQNIPPGFYTLSVRPAAETFVSVTVVNGQLRRAPPPPARVGSVSIVVGATPPLPVVIATSFGSTLAGRIELEGAADGVTPASFQLAAYPADNTGGTPGGSIARIGDDWSFQMAGMGQPSWFSFTGPPGWWMKSLTFGGMDAADRVVPFGQPDDSHSDAVAVFSRTA